MRKIIDSIAKIIKKIDWRDIVIFLIPFTVFLIALLAFLPGIITYDSSDQWAQVQAGAISDAHPFFHTFVLWVLSKIWNSETIVLIVQIILFSSIWTALCHYLRKKYNNVKHIFLIELLITVVMCCFPIMYMYSITLWKDILYSYCLLALSYFLLVGVDNKFHYSTKQSIVFGVFLVLTLSFRHNGLVVAGIIVPVVVYLMLRNKAEKKNVGFFIGSVVIAFCLTLIPRVFLQVPDNNEIRIPTAQAYSIFYMSSMIYHGVEIDNNDKEYLFELMPEEDWKKRYNPYLINTITTSPNLNKELLSDTGNQLVNLAVKYVIKNPTEAAKHVARADNMLWNATLSPNVYVYVFDFRYLEDGGRGVGNVNEAQFNAAREIMIWHINSTYDNNIINSLLYRPAFYFYLSITGVTCLIVVSRKGMYFITIMPMVLNTVSLIPTNLAQDLRYVYINYLTFFFVFLLLAIEIKKSKAKSINTKKISA